MEPEVELTPDENIARLEELTSRAGPYISTLAQMLKDCYVQLKLDDQYLDALPYKTLEKLNKYLLDMDMMCFDIWHIVSATHLKVGGIKNIRDAAKIAESTGIIPVTPKESTPMDNMVNALAASPNAAQLIALLQKRLENKG